MFLIPVLVLLWKNLVKEKKDIEFSDTYPIVDQNEMDIIGIDLAKEAMTLGISKAELYNRLVIERTGIVGVHFTGPKLADGTTESFIRYAVCTDVTTPDFLRRFDSAIAEIKPAYRE